MFKKIIFITSFLATALSLTACNPTRYVHVGPNWQAVQNLKSSDNAFDVSVITDKQDYLIGEKLNIEVNSAQSGRVWIVQVDPVDRVTLMMPNQLMGDNTIRANETYHFPPKHAGWSANASAPTGASVIAVIVTTGNTDLRDVFAQSGSVKAVMNKAFSVVQHDPAYSISTHVFNVK